MQCLSSPHLLETGQCNGLILAFIEGATRLVCISDLKDFEHVGFKNIVIGPECGFSELFFST